MTRYVPAEWDAYQTLWLGYPSHVDLWKDDLEGAQKEVEDLARALANHGAVQVALLVDGQEALVKAQRELGGHHRISVHQGRFGDVWLRDTGPIFLYDQGQERAVGFTHNGWGGKYVLPFDDSVAEQLASLGAVSLERHPFVLEGGALEHDGAGTILTTRQCLLNPNRNGQCQQEQVEAVLTQALGARHIIWLGEGLCNDHTDGHIDNLARFVGPGHVVVPQALSAEDPNTEVYKQATDILQQSCDRRGQRLKVTHIPSPGPLFNEDGDIMPASMMNFIIAPQAVIVPTYEEVYSRQALDILQGLFPDRRVIGLPSTALLSGGGSFHCISQQQLSSLGEGL